MTSHSSQNQPRQPEGQSIGGQFDKARHGESGVALGGPATGADPEREEGSWLERANNGSISVGGPFGFSGKGGGWPMDLLYTEPPECLRDCYLEPLETDTPGATALQVFIPGSNGDESLGFMEFTSENGSAPYMDGPGDISISKEDQEQLVEWLSETIGRYHNLTETNSVSSPAYRQSLLDLASGQPRRVDPDELGSVENVAEEMRARLGHSFQVWGAQGADPVERAEQEKTLSDALQLLFRGEK